MTTTLRLAFMGSPDFACPALSALIESAHNVVAVYSQPPKPAGRGKQEQKTAVHVLAESSKIPVFTPASLKSVDDQVQFKDLNLDVAVVAAYGLILPKPVLEAPKHGCLNIHASLLPRWRGAAPIHRAIQAGDHQTGITIMQMDEGLDTGDMILQEQVPIEATTTGQTLHDSLAALGAKMILQVLDQIPDVKGDPQPKEGVTYAQKLVREEAGLDWQKPATELERQIRAFDPWPGTFFHHGKNRIKVLKAAVVKGSGPPGEVLEGLIVACGEDALQILELQRPGKGPMGAEEFLRGYPIKPKEVLA